MYIAKIQLNNQVSNWVSDLVKYEYAYDEKREIKYINHLPKKCKLGFFTSLTDGELMIAKRGSGIENGGRTPHFALYKESHKYAPESELHYNTIGYLSYTLNQILNSDVKNEFNIKVTCDDCKIHKIKSLLYGLDRESIRALRTNETSENFSLKPTTHTFDYNLLQNVTNIMPEKKVDNFIPDVSLFREGILIKAIEVVHTHEDELSKVEYYKNKKVDTIHVYVKTDDDFKDLKNEIFDMIKVSLKYTECKFKEPIYKDEIIKNLHFRRTQKFRYMSELLSSLFSDMDYYTKQALMRSIEQHLEKLQVVYSYKDDETFTNSELYGMLREYSRKHKNIWLTSDDLHQFIQENSHIQFDFGNAFWHLQMGNACFWKDYIEALKHYHKHKLYNEFLSI